MAVVNLTNLPRLTFPCCLTGHFARVPVATSCSDPHAIASLVRSVNKMMPEDGNATYLEHIWPRFVEV